MVGRDLGNVLLLCQVRGQTIATTGQNLATCIFSLLGILSQK